MPGMRHLRARMLAAHIGVERTEDPGGIVAEQPDVAVEMGLEMMRLVDRRRSIVRHPLIGKAMKARRNVVAGGTPGRLEHEILDGDQSQRSVGLGLVDQDRRPPEVGVGAVAVHARIGRGRDSEQIGPEIMDSHRSELRRKPHSRCSFAHRAGRGDIALGQGDVDVAEALGQGTDLSKVGLALGGRRSGWNGSRKGKSRGGGKQDLHGLLPESVSR